MDWTMAPDDDHHHQECNESVTHSCGECSRYFPSADTLSAHFVSEHNSKNQKKYECSVCQKVFGRKQHLKRHENIHRKNITDSDGDDETDDNPGQTRIYCCEVCSDLFQTQRQLTDHRTSQHGLKPIGRGTAGNHSCDKCNEMFTSPDALAVHLKTHSGRRRHDCDQCDKSFQKEVFLRRHKLAHSDERPFECELCSVKFKEIKSLRRHERQVHQEGRINQPECDVCHKLFRSDKFLARHKLLRHEDSFYCQLCNKSFKTKQNLRQHERIHSSNRRLFECPVCNRSYQRKSTVNVHLALHAQGRTCDKEAPYIDKSDDVPRTEPIQYHLDNSDIKDHPVKEGHVKLECRSEQSADHLGQATRIKNQHSNNVNSDRVPASVGMASGSEAAPSSDEKVKPKFGCNVCGETFTGSEELRFKEHRAMHRAAERRRAVFARKSIQPATITVARDDRMIGSSTKSSQYGSSRVGQNIIHSNEFNGDNIMASSSRLTEFCQVKLEEEQIGVWDD